MGRAAAPLSVGDDGRVFEGEVNVEVTLTNSSSLSAPDCRELERRTV